MYKKHKIKKNNVYYHVNFLNGNFKVLIGGGGIITHAQQCIKVYSVHH